MHGFLSSEYMNENQLLSLERPRGLVGQPTEGKVMTYMLPAKAKDAGMMMLDVTYRQPEFIGKDPVIIFDRTGRILHVWPDGYVPGFLEVQKVARGLMG